MSCKRNMSFADIVNGLKAGRTLCIDRKDAPELDDILQLSSEGLIETELVVIDEQSSVLKARWKK